MLLSGLKNLKKDDSFVHLKTAGKTLNPKDVSSTDFGFKKKMLWENFIITLPKPVNPATLMLSLAFGDIEYYYAMLPLEAALWRFSGKLAKICMPVRHDAKELAIKTWVALSCKPQRIVFL